MGRRQDFFPSSGGGQRIFFAEAAVRERAAGGVSGQDIRAELPVWRLTGGGHVLRHPDSMYGWPWRNKRK